MYLFSQYFLESWDNSFVQMGLKMWGKIELKFCEKFFIKNENLIRKGK